MQRRPFRFAPTVLAMLVAVPGIPRLHAQDSPENASLVAQWNDYEGTYCDIWADGQYVYLPNWSVSDGNTARIHILDISDPLNPFLDDTLFVPPPNDFASPQDVKVGDGLLFVGLESDPNDGVAIFDVRDPLDRQFLTYVTVSGFQTTHNLFYADGFLYIPEGTSIAIVDLTAFDPDGGPFTTIDTPLWTLSGVGSSLIHDITVAGGRLYVAAWDSGLWIYEVSDVANNPPLFLGSVDGDNTHSMWPTVDGRYVVTGEERTGGGIQVYELIDAGHDMLDIELRDSLTFPSADVFSVHNQIVSGYRLYNSWYAKGLQVFDIDPQTGTLDFVASYDTSGSGLGNWGVYPLLGDDRILLSDANTGCFIVALDDAAQIPTLSAWGLICMTLGLSAAGGVVLRRRRAVVA